MEGSISTSYSNIHFDPTKRIVILTYTFKKMIKGKLIREAPTQDFMVFNELSSGGAETGIHFIKKKV